MEKETIHEETRKLKRRGEKIRSWIRTHKWEKIGFGAGDGAGLYTSFYEVPNSDKKRRRGILLANVETGKCQDKADTYIDTVHKNALRCIEILGKNRAKIHPLFVFEDIYQELDKRPYSVRNITPGEIGIQLRTYGHNCSVGLCVARYLGKKLRAIGFRSNVDFDIKSKNLAVANFNPNEYNEKGFDAHLNERLVPEMFTEIYEAGGRIYLFDYGSWILPQKK